MELVSANTKNYLFLTMSQYNDQNGLVRARVSMRRDQAFWEGGNSFIACESFRISAAPSQGGLYYKVLPDSYYMGAVNRESENTGNFATLKSNGHTLEAASIGTVGAIVTDQILKIPVHMCHDNTPAEGTPIVEADPAVVIPIIAELWNDHGIQEGSVIQMVANNNQNPVILEGVVHNNPLLNIVGKGGGPDLLFYPISGDWFLNEDRPGRPDDPLAAMMTGGMHELNIHNLGVRGLDDNTNLRNNLTLMLGRDAFFEICVGKNGNTDTVPVGLSGPGLEFMGPANIEVSGIPGGIWNVDGDGNNTSLKYKIYWNTFHLTVGSGVWVIIPASGGVAAHTVHGTVTAINSDFVEKFPNNNEHGPVVGCSLNRGMFRMSTELKSWLNNNANSWGTDNDTPPAPAKGSDAMENMLGNDVPWVLSSGAHIPDNITCNLEVSVTTANAPQLNTFAAALPITEFKIREDKARKLNRIERRACPQGEVKYIYTPNELYWTFNNPQGAVKDDGSDATETPYLLQTHENGGFKVVWDGTFSDFYMTEEMHDSLGLNDYFEYNYTKSEGQTTGWDVCVMTSVDRAELWDSTYQSSILHVPAGDMYIKGSHPLTPIDVANTALGTVVVSANGVTEYTLVSKTLIQDTEEKSEVVKVYPVQSYDENGDILLTWKNLPASSMGNTQQVSVESYGTFSGINIVIPNLPFQPMLGTQSDDRILASLRLPFEYGTENKTSGAVSMTDFSYYGDLLFNSDSSRSYLRITTDQQLYDCDVEARLIRRDGSMDVLKLPYKGQFEIKLRFLQTQ